MNKAVLLTGLTASLLVAGWFGANSLEPVPARATMKAHRLSLMSDEQIRDAHRVADQRAAQFASGAKADYDSLVAESAARVQRCGDVVYRARNESACKIVFPIGVMAGPLKSPSADSLFEEAVLGACAYVESAREARRAHCMP